MRHRFETKKEIVAFLAALNPPITVTTSQISKSGNYFSVKLPVSGGFTCELVGTKGGRFATEGGHTTIGGSDFRNATQAEIDALNALDLALVNTNALATT